MSEVLVPATVTPPEPVGPAPVDVTTIRATVDRALEQGPLPAREVLVELEQLLRGHIQLMLPIAEAAVEQLDRGSVEWYEQRTWLDVARDRAGWGLGIGLTTAHTHVRLLAHDTRALLRYVEDAAR